MKNYNLVKQIPEEKYYEVFIEADSNDADYISTKNKYSQEEFDEIVDELKNIRDNYGDAQELENYEPSELDIYIPSSEWGVCHTLEEITVTMFDVDGFVYNVEF